MQMLQEKNKTTDEGWGGRETSCCGEQCRTAGTINDSKLRGT